MPEVQTKEVQHEDELAETGKGGDDERNPGARELLLVEF